MRWAGSFRPARACPPSTAQRSASGTRRCVGSRWPLVARCGRALDRAGRGPWGELSAARRQTLETLAPAFAWLTGEFGLETGRLVYEGRIVSREDLDARLLRDLERGTTSLGPHLEDIAILAGDRDLRSFGSQGEQRLAVLSLLLAEASVLLERSGVPPLLLLDDVLSELDSERRATLARVLPEGGQTLVTSTSADALPLEPDQLLEVSPGEVRVA